MTDFMHPALQTAAISVEVVILDAAAPEAGSPTGVDDQLYRVDCFPGQVRAYGEQIRKAGDLVESSKNDIKSARKRMRSWKGPAGDGFRAHCDELGWSCEKAMNRCRNQAVEAGNIATELDRMATDSAAHAQRTAEDPVVQRAAKQLIAGSLPDEDEEKAKQIVLQALLVIRAMISMQVQQIPRLGRRLDNLRVPRR